MRKYSLDVLVRLSHQAQLVMKSLLRVECLLVHVLLSAVLGYLLGLYSTNIALSRMS